MPESVEIVLSVNLRKQNTAYQVRPGNNSHKILPLACRRPPRDQARTLRGARWAQDVTSGCPGFVYRRLRVSLFAGLLGAVAIAVHAAAIGCALAGWIRGGEDKCRLRRGGEIPSLGGTHPKNHARTALPGVAQQRNRTFVPRAQSDLPVRGRGR